MGYQLYALGSNGSGQLGIGHREDVSRPTKCRFFNDSSPSSRPISIVAGGNHTFVLCESGHVYAAGENRDGRCGFEEPTTSSIFHPVTFYGQESEVVERFKKCAASWEASVFVTPDNRVYVCGTGNKGELGSSENMVAISRPTLLHNFPPSGLNIVDAHACMNHVVVVLSDGSVYGWGNGKKAQLGLPEQIVWSPRKISSSPIGTTRVACGRDFTLFANSFGEYSIIGADKWDIRNYPASQPVQLKDIQAGWGSAFVLNQDGHLLSWGRNDHSQLVSPNLPAITQFAAGSEHTLVVTSDYHVLAWGWGEHGNCGLPVAENGDVRHKWNELELDGQITMVGAGCATSWICTESPFV